MRLQIKWVNGWAQIHGTGPNGKRIRRSLKTQDPRRAEAQRAALEASLWRAEVYGEASVITFEQAALAYVEDGGDSRFIVKVSEALSGTLIKDVTPRIVRDAARTAYPDASNATINRQGITPIRAVVNYAHDQGWCAPIRVKGLPVKKPKRKAVGDDYMNALRPHLPINLYALMLFLYTTGRRVGEAVDLTWDNVDLEAGKAYILRTKNGEAATAALVPELRGILAEVGTTERVFGYTDRRNIYGSLKRACKRAGVEYLGTHQVGRHSFATQLEQEGWSAKRIADAGGWRSTRMVTETYTHPDNAAARATELIGKKLASSKGSNPKRPIK